MGLNLIQEQTQHFNFFLYTSPAIYGEREGERESHQQKTRVKFRRQAPQMKLVLISHVKLIQIVIYQKSPITWKWGNINGKLI